MNFHKIFDIYYLPVDVFCPCQNNKEGCRERLVEYFEELYNVPPPAERLAGGVQHAVAAPDPPIREDPPSYQEVERVVSELRGGRAAGVCGIPAELLKAGGESMIRWLRTVYGIYLALIRILILNRYYQKFWFINFFQKYFWSIVNLKYFWINVIENQKLLIIDFFL